jgi:uncharacterized protein with ACT and thioredoxin-like domain
MAATIRSSRSFWLMARRTMLRVETERLVLVVRQCQVEAQDVGAVADADRHELGGGPEIVLDARGPGAGPSAA